MTGSPDEATCRKAHVVAVGLGDACEAVRASGSGGSAHNRHRFQWAAMRCRPSFLNLPASPSRRPTAARRPPRHILEKVAGCRTCLISRPTARAMDRGRLAERRYVGLSVPRVPHASKRPRRGMWWSSAWHSSVMVSEVRRRREVCTAGTSSRCRGRWPGPSASGGCTGLPSPLPVTPSVRHPDRLREHPANARTHPYRPQTDGKVERFNRSTLDDWPYARHCRPETERGQHSDAGCTPTTTTADTPR